MRELIFLAIALFVCLPNYSKTTVYHAKAFTVVIDAGHGGKDSGALGSKCKEKDISLKLALKLGSYIRKYLPDVRVLYTRTQDVFIPLHERTDFANKNNADVFFSIHCNAVVPSKKHIAGTETYVMGLHKAEENLTVAKRENESVLLEQDYKTNYGGYDPNSSEGHIMLSMFQNAYVSQSLILAEKIESQFKNGAKRKSRGVKQAGFVVLRTTTMPSVLIETGFLSNGTEENYLNSPTGQTYTASAIYRAFREYKTLVEQQKMASWQSTQATNSNTKKSKSNPNTVIPLSSNKPAKKSPSYNAPTVAPPKNKLPMTVQTAPSSREMYPSSNDPKTPIIYKIQLASSPTFVNTQQGAWAKIKNLECKKIGNSYKCLVGKYFSLKSAVAQQSYWRKNGYKDAFLVAFKNGKKISLQEAQKN